MLRNLLTSLAFVFALAVLLYACKKEEDTVPPIVNISSPYENQFFEVHDTMSVSATVSDESVLKSISVVLVNEDMIPVQEVREVTVNQKEEQFSLQEVIYDIYLESGTYYIRVSASDGYNTTNNYRKVSITAAPRERKGICFISGENSSVAVLVADNALVITPKIVLQGDYSASAVNSYYQDLYVAGKHTGHATAVVLGPGSVKWAIPVIQGSAPYFTNVYNDGNYAYISYYDGNLRGYDHNGVLKYTATAAQNFYPVKSLHHEEYILTEQRDMTSPVRKLVVYYAANGTGKQETSLLNQDVTAFYSKDADNVFVFGNNGSQGVIEVYSMSGNGFWAPHTLPAGRLLSVAQVDSNTYLIGHENNIVYKFQYLPLSLTPFINGVQANAITYDPVMDQVIIGDNNYLRLYNYANAGLVNSAAHNDTITAVHVWYNK